MCVSNMEKEYLEYLKNRYFDNPIKKGNDIDYILPSHFCFLLGYFQSLNDIDKYNEFINFSSELSNNVNNQNVFCFYYNSLNTNTVYEMNVYISILERLINKDNLDPLYVIDYEYGFNKLMAGIATYIRGECDPIYVDVVNQANNFVNEYNNLVLEYENIILSPENQKNMTDNSIELSKRFKLFVEDCLNKLLKKELYFSSPPITKDNALTDINFFIYNLEENIKEL